MEDDANTGTIVSIRGSLVDARFPRRLPAINNVLRAEGLKEILIEVLTHIHSEVVRGIALTSTQGLALGSLALDI